jgi:NAD(P)-dependent dehydrogenase (short-subunit alcohol dehydrogenase family)
MAGQVEQTLERRTAIVTGAGRGIGEVIALTLARRGASLVINDLDPEPLAAVAARLTDETEARVEQVVGDVASSKVAEQMVAVATAKFGTCDILVNNAGGTRASPALSQDTRESDWRNTIDGNLTSTFLCIKAALPTMRKQHYGRIVNVSSTAGFNLCATPVVTYSAAKAGIIGLTRHVAFEAAPWGITVNCVCPGHIATPPMMAKEAADKESKRWLTRQVPVGRLGEPEDIAEAVLFLASEKTSFVCGTTILVDGGLLLGYAPRDEWIR